MSLHNIIYVSSSTRRLSHSDLDALLVQARDFNALNGITGMLLHRDGNFMQAIEGPEQTLRGLYQSIARDRRHHGVITLVDEAINSREFGDWSMGFENIESLAQGRRQPSPMTAGIVAQLNSAASETTGRSRRLLAGFFERALR